MFSQADKIIHDVWEQYNQKELHPKNDQPPVHTDIFLKKIPSYLKEILYFSPLPVIQFGIGTGDAIKNALSPKVREIIGYDYSTAAIQALEKQKIIPRNINLNNVDNGSLTYINQLKTDLHLPSHVLLIRILEYIKPEALKLLLIALCEHSKPETRFYFENHYRESSGKPLPQGFIFDYPVPYELIASFFTPWPDFKTLYCKILIGKANNAEDKDPNQNSWTERFVIEKTSKSPYLDEVIPSQTNTQRISETTGELFIAKLKPDYYVDAILDVTNYPKSQRDEVTKKLTPHKIPHRICLFGEKQYLVVPNVNVKESVQEYISCLQNK